MARKTMRRDQLLRLARAGRLVMVEGYSFCDLYGESRTSKELPVRVLENCRDYRDGFCNVSADDFTSTCGHASRDGDLVRLHVHSNSHYTFRVLPEAKPPAPHAEGWLADSPMPWQR